MTYVDHDERRLRIAEDLGAVVIEGRPDRMRQRYAVTVDASGQAEGLALALRSTDVGGISTSVGIYWEPPRITFLEMYFTGVTFKTGVVEARPLMPRILEMIADGSFTPPYRSRGTAPWDDAVAALAEPADKTIFHR